MPEAGAGSSRLARAGALVQKGRLLVLGLVVAAVFSALAPGVFPTVENLGNIVRATSTDALAAAGFTLVLIAGQLDLSVGATMTLGGVALMCLQPTLGWAGALAGAVGAGLAVGLFNGLLVAKARVHSFIVTLGSLTILQGLNRALLEGGSKALEDVAVGMAAVEWLRPVLPWSPRVLLVFLPILALEWGLRRTRPGRNLYLLGGNPRTAWFAGVRTGRYLVGVFALSGVLSALGGAMTAAAQNVVMPNLGEKSLMLIVAAVIVGGTAMSGGRGSVLMSLAALAILNALTNGLGFLGASKSVKLIASGGLLATAVAWDAWRTARRNRTRGQRRELLLQPLGPSAAGTQAADGGPAPTGLAGATQTAETAEEEDETMKPTDRTLAAVCVAAVACVAIVAIYGLTLYYLRTGGPTASPGTPPGPAPGAPARPGATPSAEGTGGVSPAGPAAGGTAASAFEKVLAMRATDGQPLIWIDPAPLVPPPRPEHPERLPDDHPLRWWDYEYAGWTAEKLPMPPSPGDGPRGKKVVSLQYMDHPYWTAYRNGMRRAAEVFGIDLTIMEAGNDNKVQADQVEQAIGMKPDMVILTPVDSSGVVPMLRRLWEAKVPVIASNLLPVDEGMKYVLCWTGPDDWGQFRMLAREFARRMNYEGGYCVVRHIAGTSCFLSRTWAAVSELKKIAPKMQCLDMQSTDLKAEKTKTQVAAWLKRFGPKLKGIVSADDSKAMVGIVEALKDAGRTDVICVAAGSSRTGLEFVRQGLLHAVTYQSGESDGALPIYIAARWFSGEPIERPVYYIKKHIITAEDVDQFWPPQW